MKNFTFKTLGLLLTLLIIPLLADAQCNISNEYISFRFDLNIPAGVQLDQAELIVTNLNRSSYYTRSRYTGDGAIGAYEYISSNGTTQIGSNLPVAGPHTSSSIYFTGALDSSNDLAPGDYYNMDWEIRLTCSGTAGTTANFSGPWTQYGQNVYPTPEITVYAGVNTISGSYDQAVTGTGTTIYYDSDYDGYGDPYYSKVVCDPSSSYDYVTNSSDCDDYDSNVYPGATEILCNGTIEDCNGSYSDDDPYTDADGDGLYICDEMNTYNTNPNVADTDGGGVSDGDEVNRDGTSPTNASDDLDPVFSPPLDVCTTSDPRNISANSGWNKIYDLTASNNLVVAIKPNDNDLGMVTVDILKSSIVKGMSNTNGDEVRTLPRMINLTSSNFPSYPSSTPFSASGVDVQFYFEESEVQQMSASNVGVNGGTSISASNLKITHYSGPNENCSLTDNDFSTGTGALLGGVSYASYRGEHCMTVNMSHFSELIAHGGVNPLPVELLGFTARSINDKSIQLDWQTASEINNKGFDVEKSKDGRNWEQIGYVEGNGNTTDRQTYQLNDYNPYNGINYYRLKQTDFDGTYEYSKVVNVMIEQSNSLSIHPNPSRGGEIFLSFKNTTTGTLNIYNSQGKLVSQQYIENVQGNHEINLPELGQGIYIAELFINNEQQLTSRFIIQE